MCIVSLSVRLSVCLSVSLSVCTVCLSVSLSARSVCLSTRSACLCLTPNWLHLLYLSNQCVILPPIILLLALLRDLDLSRVPESSAKLERVWKPRSELCNTRITLGSWEHIKPYSVQKGFWGNVVFNLGDLVSIETVLLGRRACESNDQNIGHQCHECSLFMKATSPLGIIRIRENLWCL